MSKFLASDVCRPFLVSKGGQCRAKSKFGYYLFFGRGGGGVPWLCWPSALFTFRVQEYAVNIP